MDSVPQKRQFLVICSILVLGIILLYGRTIHHDFVNYDDQVYVTENTFVLQGFTFEGVKWAFISLSSGNWHPLTWISHMLDVQVFGKWAGGHHLTSVLLHALNAVVLFSLLTSATRAPWRSAFVSALFAWHPLHVESVAWVSERKDVLSGLFFLLSLLAYTHYVRRTEARQHRSAALDDTNPRSQIKSSAAAYALSFFLFACGLMSKPMVVTLPCVLLLWDLWPLQRSLPLSWNKAKALLVEKAPFFFVTLLTSLVTFSAQREGGAVAQFDAIALSVRLANAALSYIEYLRKSLWPSDLAPFYHYSEQRALDAVPYAVILLALITFIALRHFRLRPWFAFGWCFYLGTLVPVIGLVQVGMQSMADRYTYIPLIGVFIVVAWGGAELLKQFRRPMVFSSAAAVLGITGLLALKQVGYWRDSETLFRHALAVTKDNEVAHESLGNILAAQGNIDEAAKHFAQAIGIRSNYVEALVDYGFTQVLKGDIEEGIALYRRALALRPRYENGHFNLAKALMLKREFPEAAAEFRKALALNPHSIETRVALAEALSAQGDDAAAIQELKNLLGSVPGVPDLEWQLGILLARTGAISEAKSYLLPVLQKNPSAEGYQTLGTVLGTAGDATEAARFYRQALDLNPNLPIALNNLAWLRATSSNEGLRNGQEAVALAKRACELTLKKEPMFVGTLAAAYAEAGRFDEAVATANQARDLALAAGNNLLANRNGELAELYAKRTAFRE